MCVHKLGGGGIGQHTNGTPPGPTRQPQALCPAGGDAAPHAAFAPGGRMSRQIWCCRVRPYRSKHTAARASGPCTHATRMRARHVRLCHCVCQQRPTWPQSRRARPTLPKVLLQPLHAAVTPVAEGCREPGLHYPHPHPGVRAVQHTVAFGTPKSPVLHHMALSRVGYRVSRAAAHDPVACGWTSKAHSAAPSACRF